MVKDLIHVSMQGIDGEDCVEGYYATAQWNDAHCSDLKAWVSWSRRRRQIKRRTRRRKGEH